MSYHDIYEMTYLITKARSKLPEISNIKIGGFQTGIDPALISLHILVKITSFLTTFIYRDAYGNCALVMFLVEASSGQIALYKIRYTL